MTLNVKINTDVDIEVVLELELMTSQFKDIETQAQK